MKIPTGPTSVTAPTRSSADPPGLSQASPANAGASAAQPATARATLLAQVISTGSSASQVVEARLFRGGEVINLPASTGLTTGQLISLTVGADGSYQLDRSANAVNQYLLRLLLPRDVALQQPMNLLNRFNTAGLTNEPPAARNPLANGSAPTTGVNSLLASAAAAASRLLTPAASQALTTGAPATTSTAAVTANQPGSNGQAAAAPTLATTPGPARPQAATAESPQTVATGSPAMPLSSSAATQLPAGQDNILTLIRTLLGSLPRTDQLTAQVIRDAVTLNQLNPYRPEASSQAPGAGPGAIPAQGSMNQAGGLGQLLLQLAQLTQPAAGQVATGQPPTALRKAVAEALGKLLLNQLGPLLNRTDSAETDARRVDLMMRHEQQIDNVSLQFSRTDPVRGPVDDEQADADDESRTQARAWHVRLSFNLERLGQMSAVINYTEGQQLAMTFWSERADTFSLIRQQRGLLEQRLNDSLKASVPEITIEVLQGNLPEASATFTSHLVDVTA